MMLRDTKPASNRWLSYFILLISSFFAEYAFTVSGMPLVDTQLGFVTYPLLFFLGPFFWLYTNRQFSMTGNFTSKDLLHFVFPICMLLSIIIIRGASSNVSKDVKYLTIAILSVFTYVYIFFSGRKVMDTRAGLRQVISNVAFDNKLLSMKKFASVFVAWNIVGLFVIISLTTIKKHYIVIDSLLVVLTSAIVTTFGYIVVARHGDFKQVHELDLLPKIVNNTNRTIVLSAEDVEHIKGKIDNYFENGEPYNKPDLMLDEVAASINVSELKLIVVINTVYGQSFYDFVNSYRNPEE